MSAEGRSLVLDDTYSGGNSLREVAMHALCGAMRVVFVNLVPTSLATGSSGFLDIVEKVTERFDGVFKRLDDLLIDLLIDLAAETSHMLAGLAGEIYST
jgi:hypothetical protein